MATVIVEHSCVACGREFGSISRPRWAFERDGQLAGRIHTSCGQGWKGRAWGTPEGTASTAQFWMWINHFKVNTPTDAEWDALGSLMKDPDEPWGEAHERELDWSAGPRWNNRTPEQIAAIRVAYHRLVQEFSEWRMGLSPVS